MLQKTSPGFPRGKASLFLLIGGVISILLAVSVRFFYHDPEGEGGDHPEVAISQKLSAELQGLPDEQQIPAILKHLEGAKPGERLAAIDALEEKQGDAVVKAVENALHDNASIIRQRAIEVLSKIDPARGLRLLLIGLQDEDLWIRQAAVQQVLSLAKHPQTTSPKDMGLYGNAVPGLITALSDPDPIVSAAAMAALRKITGHSWYAGSKASAKERLSWKAKWEGWWRTMEPQWPMDVTFRNLSPLYPTRRDPAPDFAIKDIEGNALSRDGQKGRITLLNFWGTWCPPCQGEVPELQRVEAIYRSKGVDVIGVALAEEEGATTLRRYAESHHLTYHQTLATDAILTSFGNIHEVPVSVLIDAKGNVRYRWEGERDFATFRSAIERVLAEP